MLPRLVAHDHVDLLEGHAEPCRECRLAGSTKRVEAAHLQHVAFRELGLMMISAALYTLGVCCRAVALTSGNARRVQAAPMVVTAIDSPLAGCVAHVVSIGPEEEMVRSNARRVVAAVTDEQASRINAGVDLVRHPVRVGVPSAPAVDPEYTISAATVISPNPARA